MPRPAGARQRGHRRERPRPRARRRAREQLSDVLGAHGVDTDLELAHEVETARDAAPPGRPRRCAARPRGGRLGRGRPGARRAVGAAAPGAGGADGPVRHRPDVARLRDHLLGGQEPVRRVRRRRPLALRASPDRAGPSRGPRRLGIVRARERRCRAGVRPLHRRRVRRGLRERASSSSPRPASRSRRCSSPARPRSTARSRLRAPRSPATGARRSPTERSRLLHALADAIAANRKELAELEARNVGKAISSVKAELRRGDRALPLLRVRDRDDRRPLEPDRRLAALLLAQGAGRRRRRRSCRGTTRC